MKGQAYAFILVFIGIFIMSFFWVVLNHASIEVGDTLYSVANTTEHHDIIRMGQALFYYSLFFIILFSFLYLLKMSLNKGDGG